MHRIRRDVDSPALADRQTLRWSDRRLGQPQSHHPRRIISAPAPQEAMRGCADGFRRLEGIGERIGYCGSHRDELIHGCHQVYSEAQQILPA